MIKGTCKDCADRKVGCHAECEKYQTFRKELSKQKYVIRKKRANERMFDGIGIHEKRI